MFKNIDYSMPVMFLTVMSSKTSVVLSGVVAAIIAFALIVTIVSTGILTTRTTTETTGLVGSSQTQSGTSLSSRSTQAASQSGPNGGSGTLAVLMTDPPTVPNGTTHVYATYSTMAIHSSGVSNATGWHLLNSQGQIDLMSIINVTQTVAFTNIQSGTFNAIEFNITSAIVTYNGANYSAYLIHKYHTLFVPIPGGVTITAGQTSATVIDLTPTVLLLGDPSNPSFVFIPAARGYTIPAQSIPNPQLQRVGETREVENETWFQQNQPKFAITSVKMTPSSLAITIANTGNVMLNFKLSAVTSTASLQGGLRESLPAVASISEFFVVYPNASLVPITTSDASVIEQLVQGGGYRLQPHATATFTLSGSISLGIVQGAHQQPVQQIIPGQKYVVTISSGDRVAQTLVTAGS